MRRAYSLPTAATWISVGVLMSNCASSGAVLRPPQPFSAVVGSLIIAHRGGSLEAPENTVAAVRHGVQVGSDWQEVDVTLSRDGQVVVIHDDTVDRTTNGAGRVGEMNARELLALSAGRPRWGEAAAQRLAAAGVQVPDFGDRYADARVPLLAEVLAIPDTRLMIEMKGTDDVRRLAEAVVQEVYRAAAADRVALGSFQPALLEAAYNRDPSLPLIGIVGAMEDIAPMLELPVSVIAIRSDLAEAALGQLPAGVAVWAWTVYTVAQAEELALAGVHGLITDVPSKVVAALRTLPDPVVRRDP